MVSELCGHDRDGRPDGIIVATPNQVHIANEAEALGSSQIWILCPSHPPLSSEAPA